MPQLSLSFNFSQFFPIIGPLGAELDGEIGAKAQFSFGFDTTGLREYASDDFSDPSLILNGFYVSDTANADGTGPVTPQVQLYGSIAAYAALDLGIASAGVGGGILCTVNFTLHDPSGTGLVHLQDLESDVKTGSIFDASGSLSAFLNAFVSIDLGFIDETWSYQIASVTLAQINQPSTAPSHVPVLATQEPNGVLRLNIGADAPDRLYASTDPTDQSKPTDGNENLTIIPGPTANSVYIYGGGVPQDQPIEYSNVSEIEGVGIAGNDTITVDAPGINVDLHAGAGTNKFDVQNAGNVTLVGGSGTDTLEVDTATSATITGGSGTETLIAGNVDGASLQAGSGEDALYGGVGANQTLQGGFGTDLLVAGSGANQMLDGGSGTSTLVGGSGNDQQLFGDISNADIFGGTGSNQVLTAGSGNDHLYGGEGNGETLFGGSGTDVLQVGWHLPTEAALPSFTNLPIGAIDPTTGQPLQFGWHLQTSYNTSTGWQPTNYISGGTNIPGDSNPGLGYDYVFYAGSGDTLVIGGLGGDTIYGGSGNDVLYGGGDDGTGDVTKVLYAGVGDTQMYGGGPEIVNESTASSLPVGFLVPMRAEHILFGGSGNDVLYGGDGSNINPISGSGGVISPGGDAEDVGVNILLAGTGNNTLYSDGAGTVENTLIAGSGRNALYAAPPAATTWKPGVASTPCTAARAAIFSSCPSSRPVCRPGTPTLVGGFGLTTLLMKPSETVVEIDPATNVPFVTQVNQTFDSDIEFAPAVGEPNEFTATLNNLDTGALWGSYTFPLPPSIQRIALMGGVGDNLIRVDPAIENDMFLYGGNGHNLLIAPSGNDVLVGGPGSSILEGGTGNDALYGGALPPAYQNLNDTLGGGVLFTAPTSASVNENTVNENTMLAFTGADAISVNDPDVTSSTPEQLTLSVSHGTLTFGTTTGLSFTSGTNGSASMIVSGSLSNLNTDLGTLTYAPTAHYDGVDALLLSDEDMTDNLSGTVCVTIPVLAPSVTAPASLTVNPSVPLALTGGNAISLADLTGTISTPEQLTLTASNGTISFATTTGLTFSDNSNGSSSVVVSGMLASLTADLPSLTYTASAGAASDKLSITDEDISDSLFSPTQTVSITVNLAPIITAPASVSVNENATLNFTGRKPISVADLGGTAEQLTLSVSEGTLYLTTTTGLSVTANGTSSITLSTLSGTSLSTLNSDLTSLTYTPTPGYDGPDALSLSDEDTTDNLINTGGVSVTVNPFSLAPTLTVPSGVYLQENNTQYLTRAWGISVNDPERDDRADDPRGRPWHAQPDDHHWVVRHGQRLVFDHAERAEWHLHLHAEQRPAVAQLHARSRLLWLRYAHAVRQGCRRRFDRDGQRADRGRRRHADLAEAAAPPGAQLPHRRLRELGTLRRQQRRSDDWRQCPVQRPDPAVRAHAGGRSRRVSGG